MDVFYVVIFFILLVCLIGGLTTFFFSMERQRKAYELEKISLERQQQLQAEIIRVQTNQTLRTAREISNFLHDKIINQRILPHLTKLENLSKAIVAKPAVPKNQLEDNVWEIIEDIKETNKQLRDMSNEVLPSRLLHFFSKSLINSFENEICQHVEYLKTNIPNSTSIDIKMEGDFNSFQDNPTFLYQIYGVLDGFVTNSLQHSAAKNLDIRLLRKGNKITIDLKDNGKGFDLSSMRIRRGHQGISNLIINAISLSPNYTFTSTIGQGTNLIISINLDDNE